MMSLKLIFPVLAALVMAGGQVFSQSDLGSQLVGFKYFTAGFLSDPFD